LQSSDLKIGNEKYKSYHLTKDMNASIYGMMNNLELKASGMQLYNETAQKNHDGMNTVHSRNIPT